jgi:hypothetical protein
MKYQWPLKTKPWRTLIAEDERSHGFAGLKRKITAGPASPP